MVPDGNPMGNIRKTYCPTLQQLVQWMSTRIPRKNLQSQSHYILACDKEFSLAKRASGRPSCWAEPLRPGRLQRDSAIRWVGRASSMAWPRWRMRLVVNRCVLLVQLSIGLVQPAGANRTVCGFDDGFGLVSSAVQHFAVVLAALEQGIVQIG